jgi:hypothetical protein
MLAEALHNYLLVDNHLSNISKLGHNIDRLGSMLRNNASSQIKDYQHRFSSVADLYDTVFKDLIVDKYDTEQACITAHKFFGKDTVNFVAIDGTEHSKSMFDMVIFYAGAYSCEGNITFPEIEQKEGAGEKSESHIMTNSLARKAIFQAVYLST